MLTELALLQQRPCHRAQPAGPAGCIAVGRVRAPAMAAGAAVRVWRWSGSCLRAVLRHSAAKAGPQQGQNGAPGGVAPPCRAQDMCTGAANMLCPASDAQAEVDAEGHVHQQQGHNGAAKVGVLFRGGG
jgi:hypothetical protein